MPTSILAFDFGHKKIGIAFGQSITGTANPINVLHYKSDQALWPKLEPYITQWHPTHLLVGIPLNMDDSPSDMTVACQDFCRYLKKHTQLPVITIDERLSTRAARWQLDSNSNTSNRSKKNRSQPVDAIAAQVLIENWFQAHQG